MKSGVLVGVERRVASATRAAELFALTKPRIMGGVTLSAVAGALFGGVTAPSGRVLLMIALGTALSGGGVAAMNCALERAYDGAMERTRGRGTARESVTFGEAIVFGTVLFAVGLSVLWAVNSLTAALALLTGFSYVFLYTPLKRITWLNTFAGALPGALPALGGWTGATGEISTEGMLLFAVFYVWQLPHAWAASFVFEDDYRRGGFRMLSTEGPIRGRGPLLVFLSSCLLAGVAILPWFTGAVGPLYALAVAGSLACVLLCARRLLHAESIGAWRAVLRATVLFVPVFTVAVLLDRFL